MFGRKETPAVEPVITGTDALRARVKARHKRGHLARTAEDLSISLTALEKFANGGPLPEAAIAALVREFYVNTRWDSEIDRLVDTSPEPLKGGTPREPYQNPDPAIAKAQAELQAALRAAIPEPAIPQPAVLPKGMTKPVVTGRFARRPGFADG